MAPRSYYNTELGYKNSNTTNVKQTSWEEIFDELRIPNSRLIVS